MEVRIFEYILFKYKGKEICIEKYKDMLEENGWNILYYTFKKEEIKKVFKRSIKKEIDNFIFNNWKNDPDLLLNEVDIAGYFYLSRNKGD